MTLTPNGDAFVKPSLGVGLLPEILQELLAARKRWVGVGVGAWGAGVGWGPGGQVWAQGGRGSGAACTQ